MPKKVQLEPHLSVQELYTRYRTSSGLVERSHYQIIWLLASGHTPLAVSQVTGYSRIWIYQLLRRYNQLGAKALSDQRSSNRGQPPQLNDLQRAQLWQVLSGPAPDGGLWNGRKVADWLSEWTGEQISRHRGWEYLREMGYRLKVPRPQHQETDLSQQQQWKKNFISS